MTSRFSNNTINKILYSGIRNDHHLIIRRRGYFKHILKLSFLLIFRKRKDQPVVSKRNILNFISGSNFKLDQALIPRNSSFVEVEGTKLVWVEWFVTLAFLLNYKFFQRRLFIIASKKSERFFKEKKVEMLICGHPTFFITFLSYILNELDKKIVTIQHGIYNLNFYKVLWFEKEIATQVIVFGKYFKNLYVSQGVADNKVIIGNPYFKSKDIPSESIRINLDKGKAVFIGQQLYKVNNSIFEIYNEALTELRDNLINVGIEFFYKPHPRENIEESLNPENLRNFQIYDVRNKNIFWDDFNIFLSANSSLLIETYLQGKICFQIEVPNPEMPFDNFGDFTGIPLIKSSEIKESIFSGEYKFYCDPNYLNLKEKPMEETLKKISLLLN